MPDTEFIEMNIRIRGERLISNGQPREYEAQTQQVIDALDEIGIPWELRSVRTISEKDW